MAAPYPLVDQDDDGIMPAGKPDECFYCHQKVGTPHGPTCVVVTKTVLVEVVLTLSIRVPHHWDGHDIESHRNESSWCADNIVSDLQHHLVRVNGDSCLCPDFARRYIRTLDETPTRQTQQERREEYQKIKEL